MGLRALVDAYEKAPAGRPAWPRYLKINLYNFTIGNYLMQLTIEKVWQQLKKSKQIYEANFLFYTLYPVL